MNPLTKILIGAGAVLAAGVMIIIAWLAITNMHVRTELAEAQANDTACILANDAFEQKTAAQNKAITALQIESAARARRADLAEKAAAQTVAAYQADAAKLAQQKPGNDACKAADALLSHYIAGRK